MLVPTRKDFDNTMIELVIWKFDMIFKSRERKGGKKTKRADVMLVPTHPHRPNHGDVAQWKNLKRLEVDHQVDPVYQRPE